MKVIIAGSRTIKDTFSVEQAVYQSGWLHDITTVVSGCANGVDKLGILWANMNSIPVERFPASWDKWGKSAGWVRNEKMGRVSDALIAVWDGQSKGTKHMIDIMKRLKKPVFVYEATIS